MIPLIGVRVDDLFEAVCSAEFIYDGLDRTSTLFESDSRNRLGHKRKMIILRWIEHDQMPASIGCGKNPKVR